MKFSEWVSRHHGQDSTKLAKLALKDHPGLVLAVLVEEIEHIRRLNVRYEESRSMDAMLKAMGTVTPALVLAVDGESHVAAEKPEASIDWQPFMRLLNEAFKLGDGHRVTWGEATIEQHEQRIAMLQSQIRGTHETIRRHEQVVMRLREAGAKCLNDLVTATA